MFVFINKLKIQEIESQNINCQIETLCLFTILNLSNKYQLISKVQFIHLK